MKTLLTYTLLLFGLISLQASCQKSEPKPLILNDPEFLSYWFFPAGSYWIYEDSLSGALDTFLIETANVWEQNNRYGDNNLQHHGISVKNRNRIGYQVGKPYAFSSKDEGLYSLDESSGNYFTFRFYYDKNGSSWFSGNTIVLYNKYIDSIEIKSRKYYKIYRIDTESQITTDSISRELYAKNIGVIKQVFKSGRVMELKEYYISQ